VDIEHFLDLSYPGEFKNVLNILQSLSVQKLWGFEVLTRQFFLKALKKCLKMIVTSFWKVIKKFFYNELNIGPYPGNLQLWRAVTQKL